MNDKFDVQAINSTRINILIYLVNNNNNNKLIESFDNNIQVIYNDNIDVLKSDTNKNNISSNLELINTNKTDISSNLEKTDDNTNDISNNLEKIDTNKNNISSNLEKIDNFKQYISESTNHFKQTFNIEKQIFRFNRTSHFYVIFEAEITHNFTKNSLLFIDINIHYKYENLLNDYYRLQHQYDIYDNEGNLIYGYLFNKDTFYDEKKLLFY